MSSSDIKDIEHKFRTSNAREELFDTFQLALQIKMLDVDIYKILLANPALTKEELILYIKKLVDKIPGFAYEIYMFAANLFECAYQGIDCIEYSLKYYEKAVKSDNQNNKPLINALGLYNFDLDTPLNSKILKMVDIYVRNVKKKSKVYYALADIYKKMGNNEKRNKYLRLAEKSSLLEH